MDFLKTEIFKKFWFASVKSNINSFDEKCSNYWILSRRRLQWFSTVLKRACYIQGKAGQLLKEVIWKLQCSISWHRNILESTSYITWRDLLHRLYFDVSNIFSYLFGKTRWACKVLNFLNTFPTKVVHLWSNLIEP